MKDERETYEVSDGDVLLINSAYFYVREVREPQHPAYPGLTFWGYFWRSDREVWSGEHAVPAPYGDKWNVVADAPRLFPAMP